MQDYGQLQYMIFLQKYKNDGRKYLEYSVKA